MPPMLGTQVVGGRRVAMPDDPTQFSFCETAAALGAWHIRRLTKVGRKLGGGADTKTLCGLTAAWDVQCEFSDERLEMIERAVPHQEAGRPCPACVQEYKAMRALWKLEE